MKESNLLRDKSIEIVIEAARRFAFYDIHREHPFTKKLHAAIAFLNEDATVNPEQIRVNLFLDDSLKPTPIWEKEYENNIKI